MERLLVREFRATRMLARQLRLLRGRCEAFADLFCGDSSRSAVAVTRAYAAVLRDRDSTALSVLQLQWRLVDYVRRYGLELNRHDESSVVTDWDDARFGQATPALVAAMRALPYDERHILSAIYLGGRTVSEVAGDRGMDRSMVMAGLRRGVDNLRRFLR